jgi:hypothetical protein
MSFQSSQSAAARLTLRKKNFSLLSSSIILGKVFAHHRDVHRWPALRTQGTFFASKLLKGRRISYSHAVSSFRVIFDQTWVASSKLSRHQ